MTWTISDIYQLYLDERKIENFFLLKKKQQTREN